MRQDAHCSHLGESRGFFGTEPVLSLMKGPCKWETLVGPFSCDTLSRGLSPGLGLLLRHSQVKVSFLPEQWTESLGAREGKSSRNANDYLPGVSVLFSVTDTPE